MKSICVYCGSSSGNNEIYTEQATALGKLLAKRNIKLVYGGANVGLMGVIADTVLDNGGKAIGIIPESLVAHEVAHPKLTELKIVDSMHARKAMMAELSDGFIAMPGGLGTLEELFEILTWGQLGFHHKPCAILNVNGYYDKLLEYLEHAVGEQLLKPKHRQLLLSGNDPDAVMKVMDEYKPCYEGKWIDKEST